MKKITILSILIVGAFSQIHGVIVSEMAGWHKLAEKIVNFKTDKDEIRVLGTDRYSHVKIRVEESPINLISFDIHFDNDTKQSVAIGENIKSPGETKEVKLEGGDRNIKKVVFWYKTVSSADKRARVELWGMKSEDKPKDK